MYNSLYLSFTIMFIGWNFTEWLVLKREDSLTDHLLYLKSCHYRHQAFLLDRRELKFHKHASYNRDKFYVILFKSL